MSSEGQMCYRAQRQADVWAVTSLQPALPVSRDGALSSVVFPCHCMEMQQGNNRIVSIEWQGLEGTSRDC